MSLVFTVKELSKITNVSARNIRYYDTIGLFEPSGISDNGYRYYTIEKIEELRLISYLRHAGISIKSIKRHLDNRNIDDYTEIIKEHIDKLDEELIRIQSTKLRLQNRLKSLDYIRQLPPLNDILIEKHPKRAVLKIMKKIMTPFDWEQAMTDFEKELPPSLMIGETGFFVDIFNRERQSTEFEGMYMFANDPFSMKSEHLECLSEGFYLTTYIKGDHKTASTIYSKLITYASEHGFVLENYALERTLIDHFISSDEDLYITEISIPIK